MQPIDHLPASVRDRDAQSGPIHESASTYGITALQIPDSGSDPCADNVKPARADLTSENPGATEIATEAKDVIAGVCLCGEYIAAFPILAMHWGALV